MQVDNNENRLHSRLQWKMT